MTTATPAPRGPRIAAVMRDEARVTPLELFFDLVFVLALTQCTQLMADVPTWQGVGQAMLILAVLWWSWSGYAWLTSVVNPEEGPVRIVFFAAMAGFLVASLCISDAFGDAALLFAGAYLVVRVMHILLFVVASREDPGLRTSVLSLAASTAVGTGLLVAAAAADDGLQAALWITAIVLDYGGPFFFGVAGWKLVPSHFAERFGLIIIVALGESIVAIGAGVDQTVDAGIVAAAALGMAVAAALWWLYFDVVALVAERRLSEATPGREQNMMARDSYGYLHLTFVAGIVLIALGMKKTLGEVGDPLKAVPAAALLGGTSLYLLGHVAFRLRNIHTFNKHRFGVAVLLVALIPLALEIPALAMLAVLAAILTALIAYEAIHFAAARDRVRHRLAHGHPEA